jgi:hypothetical protein
MIVLVPGDSLTEGPTGFRPRHPRICPLNVLDRKGLLRWGILSKADPPLDVQS